MQLHCTAVHSCTPRPRLHPGMQEGLVHEDRDGIQLQALHEICLDGLLLTDADTLRALQIFQVQPWCCACACSQGHAGPTQGPASTCPGIRCMLAQSHY